MYRVCHNRDTGVYELKWLNIILLCAHLEGNIMSWLFLTGFLFYFMSCIKHYLAGVLSVCCTFSNSLRSDTSMSVRLAMSLTSCWILGEYCLGIPSKEGVAMASDGLTGLVLSVRRAHSAAVCRLCLWNESIQTIMST